MKIAFYMQDGLEQLVFTPESDTEKAMLGKLHDGTRELSVLKGSFYECRGGWVRHVYDDYGHQSDDQSTMLVLRPARPIPTPATE